jgi:hypothetical protein
VDSGRPGSHGESIPPTCHKGCWVGGPPGITIEERKDRRRPSADSAAKGDRGGPSRIPGQGEEPSPTTPCCVSRTSGHFSRPPVAGLLGYSEGNLHASIAALLSVLHTFSDVCARGPRAITRCRLSMPVVTSSRHAADLLGSEQENRMHHGRPARRGWPADPLSRCSDMSGLSCRARSGGAVGTASEPGPDSPEVCQQSVHPVPRMSCGRGSESASWLHRADRRGKTARRESSQVFEHLQ